MTRTVWQISDAIEAAVWAAAQPSLRMYCDSTSALLAAVEDRSRRYTSERDALDRPSDAQADLAARALFFTVADAAKVHHPLSELHAAGRIALDGGAPLRILDVGAGCGAMSLGLLDWVARSAQALQLASVRGLDITLLERDGAALALAAAALKRAAASFGVAITITEVRSDVTAGTWMRGLRPFDLIIAGTVFNELPESHRLSVASAALQLLTPSGHAVIIEPALRETSRGLHRLRDALVGRGAARVVAPCVHNGPVCPALADEDDWCHEELLGGLPPRAAELARLSHLRDSGLKFAYLTLVRSDSSWPRSLRAVDGQLFRIMRPPRGLKGRVETLACGEPGWVPLRLLRRHRTDGNRAVQDAHRGDIVVLHTAHKAEGNALLDVVGDDRVELMSVRMPTQRAATVNPAALPREPEPDRSLVMPGSEAE
jgi:ribosomal protein RSM22 (predicted rRNA methylase)